MCMQVIQPHLYPKNDSCITSSWLIVYNCEAGASILQLFASNAGEKFLHFGEEFQVLGKKKERKEKSKEIIMKRNEKKKTMKL